MPENFLLELGSGDGGEEIDRVRLRAGGSFFTYYLPSNIFADYSVSKYYLSVPGLGQKAITQASEIKTSVYDLTAAGADVGMLLDKGDTNYTEFAPTKPGERKFDDMVRFLSNIDEGYLLSNIAGNEFENPPGSSNHKKYREERAAEFKISIERTFSLLSEDEKILKHIVILTVGPKFTSETIENDFSHFEDPEINGVSISSYFNTREGSGYWPGVPLFEIQKTYPVLDSSYKSGRFLVPAFRKANFNVKVSNASKSYNYNLVMESSGGRPIPPKFSFLGHSISRWDTDIEWKALDVYGEEIASYTQSPDVYRTSNDTGLVKMWAGSDLAFSEIFNYGGLGPVYGIVTEDYSLLALEEDSVSAELQEALSDSGVPMLTDDEIFVLETDTATSSIEKESPGISAAPYLAVSPNPFNPVTRIAFNTKKDGFVLLEIYDLSGRLVATVMDRYLKKGEHSVMFSGASLPSGIFVCRLKTGSGIRTARMMLMK